VVGAYKGDTMTASEQAIAAGLPSLAVVSTYTGVARSTLNDWHRDKPDLFAIVLRGCQATQEQAR